MSHKVTSKSKHGNVATRGESGLYFRDITAISQAYSVARETISRHKRHSNLFPAKTPKGYPAAAVEDFMVACGLKKDSQSRFDKDQEIAAAARARRLRDEFDLAERKKKVIDRDEHARQMRQLAELFVHGTEIMVQCVQMEIRQESITKKAEQIRDDIRAAIADKVAKMDEVQEQAEPEA